MISCAASDSQDIVLKKSLYQYITTYANANLDLMLLTINMLLKDCQDHDPTVRGLALRSLCSLTISNLTEYLVSKRCLGAESCGFLKVRKSGNASQSSESCNLHAKALAVIVASDRLQHAVPVQMSPIQRGLDDRHPYVRRTAVMGVLKVYIFDAAAVTNAGKQSLGHKHKCLSGAVATCDCISESSCCCTAS